MRSLLYGLFALTGGLALSGIVANLYRIFARKPQHPAETALHYAVMTVAGPSVLFENATRSFTAKACSAFAYAIAVALAAYWAFALGLGVLDIGLAM